MKRALISILIPGLALAIVLGPVAVRALADDKDEEIKQLKAELEKAKKESASRTPPGQQPGNIDPAKFRDQANMAKQFDKQIDDLKAKQEKIIKEHGEDSAEAKKVAEQLKNLENQKKRLVGGPGGQLPEGVPNPGDPGERDRFTGDMRGRMRFGPGAEGMQPGLDMDFSGMMGTDMAYRIMVSGLEAQLNSLAALIREATDEKEKEELTAELKETAAKLVKRRLDTRAAEIKKLEARLEELKNAKDDESADDLVAKYLGEGDEKDADDEKKEEKKGASK